LWLIGLLAVVGVYALAVLALVLAGRREQAVALARFIPDCLVLLRRLAADPRVPRSRRFLLVLGIAYLAMPFDLVPDFIPIAGQLDDVVVVGLLLRGVVRGAGDGVVREHWPGPEAGLRAVLAVAGGRDPRRQGTNLG